MGGKTLDAEVIELRRLVCTFLTGDVLPSIQPLDGVLEIGPMHAGSCPSPDHYVDTRAAVIAADASYVSIDPDPAAHATITANFLVEDIFHPQEKFDHIIACEVFEHVPDIWKAPAVLRSLLKPGGTLWFSTPFHFRLHGPKPDCWRFTADGLRALFGGHFDLTILPSDDGPTPLHYRVVAK